MFKYLLALMLMIASQQAFGSDCKSLIQHHIEGQLESANLFNANKNLVVVIVCAQKPVPLFDVMYTNLMSQEKLEKSTPMTTFVKLKQPINPNGKSKTTGFLAADRDTANSFTLRLRSRLATGEAIDIAKKIKLSAKQSIVFENSEIHVGAVRLGLPDAVNPR